MPRATLQHKALHRARETAMVEGGVYMTPLGRLCKLLPEPPFGVGSNGLTLCFAYLRNDGVRMSSDGFHLHRGLAQRILQRVA
jgi:hypothetical protein